MDLCVTVFYDFLIYELNIKFHILYVFVLVLYNFHLYCTRTKKRPIISIAHYFKSGLD